jgi:oxygen-independent coproporphyrinogen-3 oxidase
VEDYLQRVGAGDLPVFRGHLLSDRDLAVREVILDLMCRFGADLAPLGWGTQETAVRMALLEADGIVAVEGTHVRVTPEGRACVRNACMVVDPYMAAQDPGRPMFSRTI